MEYTIRELRPDEYGVLRDILYEAIFIPEGVEPPPKNIVDRPELKVYTENFGESTDDICLAAVSDGKILGAVWSRIMDDYGHIDDRTPSLAIALFSEYRGMGIGTALMRDILGLLKTKGYERVSLAVQKENYAVRMYRAAGFETVGENSEEYIMVCRLSDSVTDSIFSRRSIRRYLDKAVSRETVTDIIKAACAAPSAKNRQPWRFTVFGGEEKEKLLDVMEKGIEREASGNSRLPGSANGLADARHTLSVMRSAPVIITVTNTNAGSPFEQIDADSRVTEICDTLSIGAAVENMLLRADALGLGTLWIANTCFAYDELCEYIGAKGQLTGAVALGHPDERPAPRPRKAINDICEFRM